jgi:hypothetical protein
VITCTIRLATPEDIPLLGPIERDADRRYDPHFAGRS